MFPAIALNRPGPLTGRVRDRICILESTASDNTVINYFSTWKELRHWQRSWTRFQVSLSWQIVPMNDYIISTKDEELNNDNSSSLCIIINVLYRNISSAI